MWHLFLLGMMCSSFLFSCAPSLTTSKESENAFNPLSAVIGFYQGPLNHLSAVKQSECPMYPSCSEYSREVMETHGFIVGWMMICDRLMRCGRDEMKLSPRIIIDGKLKYYDPVRNNEW